MDPETQLRPKHKQYILKHKNDIIENNWEEFFKPANLCPEGIGEPLYLAKLPFMEELKRVPNGAFYNCSNLIKVVIPATVTNIGSHAFWSCTSLALVTFDSVDNSRLTNIGDWAFYNCSSLVSIKIPSGVTNISYSAFSNCSSLTSITIPASVTSIKERAFYNIPTDLVITYNGTKAEWKQICDTDSFKGTYFTVNCIDGTIVKRKRKK